MSQVLKKRYTQQLGFWKSNIINTPDDSDSSPMWTLEMFSAYVLAVDGGADMRFLRMSVGRVWNPASSAGGEQLMFDEWSKLMLKVPKCLYKED